MPEQSEGMHTLTFRAWDMYNNSSTASLNFQVVKGMDPQIYSVTTYPNPVSASETLNIEVVYDQPDEVIEMELVICDVSGQVVLTHKQVGADGLKWSIDSIASKAGVYVYRVKIKTATSNFVSRAGKTIVTK